MKTIKVMHEGKEIEVQVNDEQLKKSGLRLQTDLIADDELFNEAAEMRNFKTKNAGTSKEVTELKNLIAAQSEQVKALSDALTAEKKAREDATAALQADAEKKKSEKIEQLLTTAINEGRITAEKKDSWKEKLSKDFDAFSEIINELPKTKMTADDNSNNQQNSNNNNNQQNYKTSLTAGSNILDAIKQQNQNAAITVN